MCTHFHAACRRKMLFEWAGCTWQSQQTGSVVGSAIYRRHRRWFFPTLPDPKMSIDNSVHRFINSMANLLRKYPE
jgi:hypothetical protein